MPFAPIKVAKGMIVIFYRPNIVAENIKNFASSYTEILLLVILTCKGRRRQEFAYLRTRGVVLL